MCPQMVEVNLWVLHQLQVHMPVHALLPNKHPASFHQRFSMKLLLSQDKTAISDTKKAELSVPESLQISTLSPACPSNCRR